MQSKSLQVNLLTVSALIAMAILSRLIPHPANFAPLMAIGIFGGALFKNFKWALLIPILSIWLSDIFINNVIYGEYYDEFVWFYEGFYWQYIIYILLPIFTKMIIGTNISVSRVFGISFLSAIVFFVISNFGVWVSGTMYPFTMEGLISCYTLAIPFFKGTILSNIFYTSVLFLAYYIVENKMNLIEDRYRFNWKLV